GDAEAFAARVADGHVADGNVADGNVACGHVACGHVAGGHVAGGLAGAVIVAGGDGTINEALNGMAGAPLGLGLIPIGTANVLAHELGIGASMARAARALIAAQSRTIRLGRVDGHYFAMMAGVGFDAAVVAGIDPAVKRRFGKGAYVLSGLRVFLGWRPHRYRVTIDGAEYEAASAVCCNGRFYGGRFVLAEAARLDDDRLHVVLFGRSGRWAILRYLVAMVLGLIPRLGDVRVVEGREIRIEAADGAAEPVQADGDIVARLPVRVTMAAEETRVFVP
ncbi:diacylglycerol kinase family protein, partial [Stella sp.]|uniref:diacylglycerol/lipid kinase family protein n=1 Tax=Stella sp. TaxID=2912054 RepID=UPI0035B23D08